MVGGSRKPVVALFLGATVINRCADMECLPAPTPSLGDFQRHNSINDERTTEPPSGKNAALRGGGFNKVKHRRPRTKLLYGTTGLPTLYKVAVG